MNAALSVVLYGAGGHAKVCLDVLLDSADCRVVAVVTDSGDGRSDLGHDPVRADGYLETLTRRGERATFVVAIGGNGARQVVSSQLVERGHEIGDVVARSAIISRAALLQPGVQILQGAIVMAAATVGAGTIINTNASVDHDCVLGDYVHVAPGAVLAGDVIVGDRTLIGVGARVIPGRRIGADAIVGAGAVVIDDVPPGVTVVGNPARPIGRSTRDSA